MDKVIDFLIDLLTHKQFIYKVSKIKYEHGGMGNLIKDVKYLMVNERPMELFSFQEYWKCEGYKLEVVDCKSYSEAKRIIKRLSSE